jgi:hypothetical protein
VNTYPTHAAPPRSLAERLERLNGGLKELAERLKQSIASLVGSAIAEAVRDAVHALLGGEDRPVSPRYQNFPSQRPPGQDYRGRWDEPAEQRWYEEDHPWREDEPFEPPPAPAADTSKAAGKRWRHALTAAAQAGLFWLKARPCRRPVATALAATLAAGVVAFVAGPAAGAAAGVLASVASLLLTAQASRSAAALLSG